MIKRANIDALPDTFGIYKYFDINDRLLYVGKAKSIKKRVKSYFGLDSKNELIPNKTLFARLQNMVAKIERIEFIIVSSESEALILENSQIKQLKPKYNILLRDDKTYPYIFMDMGADFPRLEITRRPIHSKSAHYFGPYPTASREIVESIYELCKLVQQKSCLKSNKPCMFYQINRCQAPCAGLISKESYQKIAKKALELLENKNLLIKKLQDRMHTLAESLLFEEANVYKERIVKIQKTEKFSNITNQKKLNLDVITLAAKDSRCVLFKLFMREGKITSTDSKIINLQDEIDERALNEIYKTTLFDSYKERLPLMADEILIDAELEDRDEILEFIKRSQNTSVKLTHPNRGFKSKLLQIANQNAQAGLLIQNDEDALLARIKSSFSLKEVPYSIEIFDTSHHAQSFSVGAMVCYENGKFIKNSYKKYNLESGDEAGQMRELLSRRVNSFDKNPPPNLWLLDGGIIQRNIALNLLKKAGVSLDVIAISKEKINSHAYRAKGGARDILHADLEFRLQVHDERLMFFQKLRDEAHRFAIKFHRESKTKSISRSLPYSSAHLKKLLDFYGSFHALSNASPKEISEILKRKNHQDDKIKHS